MADSPITIGCVFCGKRRSETRILIGDKVFICKECVEVAAMILASRSEPLAKARLDGAGDLDWIGIDRATGERTTVMLADGRSVSGMSYLATSENLLVRVYVMEESLHSHFDLPARRLIEAIGSNGPP